MEDVKYTINFSKSFELKLDTEIPAMFKDVQLRKYAHHVWGIASNSDMDAQGERIILDPTLAPDLEKPPYNKLYLEHDHSGKNTGMGCIGIIKFSRIVPGLDNQHVILAELNEHHPAASNILGSIQNKNLDCFSVAGRAERKTQFNEVTGKNERIAVIKELRETSATSMPANAGAGILGTFIAKNNMEGLKMDQDQTFVPMEAYTKDIGEIKDTLKTITESVGKHAEAMKGMHEGFTKLQKDMEEPEEKPKEDESKDETKDEGTDTEDKEAEDKDKEAKAKTTDTEKKDEMTLMKEKVEKIEKAMSTRVGHAHSDTYADYFEKTDKGELIYTAKKSPTPIVDKMKEGI